VARVYVPTFAAVKHYKLRWFFHLRLRSIYASMGSYPRCEKAEQKACERADTVPVLDCQRCGALTPGEQFRYCGDRIVCDACEERHPQSRRCLLPRVLLQPRSILVNFVVGSSLAAQAMTLDHRTKLGPQLKIQSAATLRRLLGYLGGTQSSLPTSMTAIGGGGVRAPSRSRCSRAARTCSRSTTSGSEPNAPEPSGSWIFSDWDYFRVGRNSLMTNAPMCKKAAMGPPQRPETSSFARFGSSSRHVHCIINEITGAIYETDGHFLSGAVPRLAAEFPMRRCGSRRSNSDPSI
jgi:hypothetical protein